MNLKKVLIQIISLSAIAQLSMFGMMRRIAPTALTAACVALTNQSRSLLPGQDKHPAWIQANKEIVEFRKFHKLIQLPLSHQGFPTIPQSSLDLANKYAIDRIFKILKSMPTIKFDSVKQASKESVNQEIIRLFKKHGINPDEVPITFINAEFLKISGQEETCSFFVCGNELFVNLDVVINLSADEIIASIEHEFCHLITQDSAFVVLDLPLWQKDKAASDRYKYLREKRSDVHSAIQSKKNTEMLMNLNERLLSRVGKGVGYDKMLKCYDLIDHMFVVAPAMFKNSQVIEMLSAPYLDPLFFEKTKQIAIQEYKAKKISPSALQEIIRLCDKPTYLDEMLQYHIEQEKMKH